VLLPAVADFGDLESAQIADQVLADAIALPPLPSESRITPKAQQALPGR
jgi:hypothetical protein